MFISSKFLTTHYGLDETIARFFADREPPTNNLYWHKKLLYLRPAPGYLFIPLIVDLLHKIGIEKEQLLSEKFVGTMEDLGHISALEETKQITKDEAIITCTALIKTTCSNTVWFNNVLEYFDGNKENSFKKLATPFTSLHRGDIFLFSLSTLNFPPHLSEKIAATWFALISTLLLLDDADDVQSDKESGDENAFLESGMTAEGIERIAELVKSNLVKITAINETMAAELQRQHKAMMKLHSFLN